MARHGTPTPGQAILEGLIAGTVEITREYAEALESVTGSPAAYWRMLASKAKLTP